MAEFKEFLIGEMFDIATGRDLIIGNTSTGNIPLISHQNSNNGIVKYIKPISNRRIFDHKKTIALADRGLFYATVQSQDFHIGTRVKALTLKGDIQKKEVLLFIAASINKLQILFTEYLVNATDKLPSLTIKLPICIGVDGKMVIDELKTYSSKGYIPDFDYMQEYISKLEKEQVTLLDQYLVESNLNKYELDDTDIDILSVIPTMKEFKIVDIFEVKNSHNILKSNIKLGSGCVPYVTASSENNGVMGYIDYDESFKEKGNCIFIGGKSMTVNYQENDFFSNDSHNLLLTLRNEKKRNAEIQLYMVTVLQNSLSPIYIWNDSISYQKIQKDIIYLPIKTDNGSPVIDTEYRYHKDGYIPDFDYMEKYIRAVQKKVVADVIKYKDEVIS